MGSADFGYRAFTFCGASFQTLRSSSALSAFARRYSRNRGCFLFLCLLRCFTSARSLLTPMHSAQGTPKGGLPHSDTPGSRLGYQLPWAFRRFLRPSSPLDAKTSTVCPFAWSYQPDADAVLADPLDPGQLFPWWPCIRHQVSSPTATHSRAKPGTDPAAYGTAKSRSRCGSDAGENHQARSVQQLPSLARCSMHR